MKPPCNPHNPSRTSRTLIVAGVFAVPGALGGALVAVFAGGLSICVVAGILFGSIIGAMVETWPFSRREIGISRDGTQVTEIHLERPIHELSKPKPPRPA